MPGLKARQTAWRAGMMVRVQSIIILLLLILLAEEYNSDTSFQSWVTWNMGVFGFLFSGSIAAIYGGVLIALYLSPPLQPATRRKTEKLELVIVNSKSRRTGS